MLSAIRWAIKTAVFSAVVLVIANVVRWDGRTLSDQVRVKLAQVERSAPAAQVRDWWRSQQVGLPTALAPQAPAKDDREEILHSERQKLRDLIRDLNTARVSRGSH